MNNIDIKELLSYIDPGTLDYQTWVNVGMALKQEGYPVSAWDDWSRRDSGRYHAGECEKKWKSFQGSADPVTGGTLYQLAVQGGYQPFKDEALEWDSVLSWSEGPIVDSRWVENREIEEPKEWNPAEQIRLYLETLFEANENVGYVMKSWKNEKGKYVPQDKGTYDRTAGQLIEELSKYKGDISKAIGDYDPEGGAWIRFNPLDGQGVRNTNVTEFRYALVESDDMELEKQNALIRELELPVACLVYSGKKSIHAIVKIDASDYSEYKKRVDYLYNICEKNGMRIDTQNRNPSRLSRLPGVTRGEHKQFIIDTNIGRKDWADWYEWIESANDDLPDVESLSDVWDRLPELSDCLIDNVLRKGHKMLLVGPSKSGKSFLQIELCIAIAEGKKWLNWQCAKGRVMYVNLELDRASCLHRFRDAYEALGIRPDNINNIDIWNLRGKAIGMDKLAPRLIRRAQKKDFSAIIIDPIYKVITGDENSADQMAKFCNQFDKVCAEVGCAVIYCHHHSKGLQGQKKSMDRASGSGVFARDPDAMIDMIELEISEDLRKQEVNKVTCSTIRKYLEEETFTSWNWKEEIGPDDWLNSRTLINLCENKLNKFDLGRMNDSIQKGTEHAMQKTAWRLEGTLREFPPFPPVNIWFDYPMHCLDDSGVLQDIQPEDPTSKLIQKRKDMSKAHWNDVLNEIEVAYEGLSENEAPVRMKDVAEQLEIETKQLGQWLGEGKNSKPELKKRFKKDQPEKGGPVYLIRV